MQPSTLSLELLRRLSRTASPNNKVVAKSLSAARPYEEIPGPKKLPIIGHNHLLLSRKFNQDGHELFMDYHQEYGDIMKFSFPLLEDIVIIYRPEDMETVFKNDGRYPDNAMFDAVVSYREVVGKEVFTETYGVAGSRGKDWYKVRSLVQQDMMRPSAALYYLEGTERVTEELMDRLRRERDERGEVKKVDVLLEYWTLESIAKIFLEARLGCLDDPMPTDAASFIKRLGVQNRFLTYPIMVILSRVLHLPRRYWWLLPGMKAAIDNNQELLQDHDKIVEGARERQRRRAQEEVVEGSSSILAKLFDKCGVNSQIPVVMAMDTLLAGVDTTSSSCLFLLYHLAQNQDRQELLHQEICDVVGKDGGITGPKLNKMPYLKACVQESSRISPVSSGLVRRSQVDLELAGYRVPSGTHIIMSPFVCRNTYFTDPAAFKPERWLRKDRARDEIHPFLHLPFGFGPRMCLGRRFAEMEMYVLLIKILQRFRVEYRHGKMGMVSTFVCRPKGKLDFVFAERQ